MSKTSSITFKLNNETRLTVSKDTFEPNLYSVYPKPYKGQRVMIFVTRHGQAFTVIGECESDHAWTVKKAFNSAN